MAELNFKGKAFVQNHHFIVPVHELVADEKKSKLKKGEKPRLDDNLIIHGDNLKALKALLPIYAGKIDCVFIDPPYNLGSEHWVYNDNVNSPMMQAWLGKEVGIDDLSRHDKWLCMMMPRLKLIRELMRDDAAIFITLDDTEIHRCKLLLDEIFGESNFVTDIPWQARKSVQNDTDISMSHNHVLVYAKNRRQEDRRLKKSNENKWGSLSGFVFRPLDLDKSKFSNPDGDKRGLWKTVPFDAPGIRRNLSYTITNPGTGEQHVPPNGRHWSVEEPTFKLLMTDKRILFGKSGKGGPQVKVFWEEKSKFGEVSTTWWGNGAAEAYIEDNVDEELAEQFSDFGTTTRGSQLLQSIFGGEKVFENPKPIELIRYILKVAANSDALILDSFAGSGSTAHAVLAQNVADSGKRRFILIQIEENVKQDTPAHKLGFKKVIDITSERVRRVMDGVTGAKDEELKKGLGGSFSYFELGDAIDKETLLKGKKLPSYAAMAAYVFHTAISGAFDAKKMNEKKGFIGSTDDMEVYLIYKPNVEFLKEAALNADFLKTLGKPGKKVRLVFAPVKYIDDDALESHKVEFAQLPQEIYRR